MTLKTRLHAQLFNTLETRKATLALQRSQISIDSTQSGKGSAGDKHEVGIAMAQLEIEKLDQQLALVQQQLSTLQKIDPQTTQTQILMGSMFEVNHNWYYCCVPFGQIQLDELSCFCLSLEAPLFKALKGKKAAENIQFNGQSWLIQQVC